MSDLSLPVRPIVHIGYHKTATTWFQKHVWPSADQPRMGAARNLAGGVSCTAGHAFRSVVVRGNPRPRQPAKQIVLSEENLSGYIHNGGMHGLIGPEMARRIRAVLPDARIVIFVRNQREIVRAAYAQYVSGGGTFSLERYLDSHRYLRGALTRPYKAPAFEWEHFEFDRLIAHYDKLFGRENVHVYPYEALRDRSALLRRMRRELGIAVPLRHGKTAARPTARWARARCSRCASPTCSPGSRWSTSRGWSTCPAARSCAMRSSARWRCFRRGRFVLPEDTLGGSTLTMPRRTAAWACATSPLEELGYPLAPALPQAAARGALRTAA